MALTIETGAIVAGADSYATVTELRTFAAKRNYSVPASGAPGDTTCEQLLVKACDYLQGFESRFQGDRVTVDQVLAFPRYGVLLNGFELDGETIPQELKDAQILLAIEAQTADLQPTVLATGQKGAVTKEKVDVIEVEYAEPIAPRTTPLFAKAQGLLAKLFRGGGGVSVVRV